MATNNKRNWNIIVGIIMGSQLDFDAKRELISFVREVESTYEKTDEDGYDDN